MIGLQGRTKLFSGTANRPLATKMAKYLKIPLGKMEVNRFSDGEIKVEIEEHVRGHHIILVQPTSAPANDNIMELMIMADAFRRSAVKSITAVIPYYGYARQDRRPDYTRTPITSRLVADMIQTAGINQVIVVDIHSGQQQGFFTIPIINVSAAPQLVGDIWRTCPSLSNHMVVSPDTGGVVRARAVAKQLGDADLAIIDKRRPEANKSEVMNIIGNVEGKHCIIIDDMIDTGGTLAKGAEALKEKGAASVVAYATHGVFSGGAYKNIDESCLDQVVVTDTLPLPRRANASKKIKVVSMAPLLAETIQRIRNKESISNIYTGH